VLGEQPRYRCVDITSVVADTEGRALEDREGHQGSFRTIRVALDCASALTTISSTLRWCGRVTAKTTHSATSSGCTACTLAYTFCAASSSPRKRTREKFVSTRPGSTVVRWIGRPSRSSRSAYVNPRTANFDVTYRAPFSYAWRPATEPMLTSCPP